MIVAQIMRISQKKSPMLSEQPQTNIAPDPQDSALVSGGKTPVRPGRAVRLVGWIVILVAPLLILVLLEAVLRWAGIGYDPRFFIPATAGSDGLWMTNPAFGRRFFPRHMVREPEPCGVRMPKPEHTRRVVVLGGSAAMGDPDTSYGLVRILDVLLQDAFPKENVEVINAAMTAINSHVVLPIARDCLEMGPDVLVVYMGNNEVVGPFGVAAVRPDGSFSGIARLGIWIRRFRLGQAMSDLLTPRPDECHEATQVTWQGMEHFLDQDLSFDDPRLNGLHSAFRRNLEQILSLAGKRNLPVILCTVPVNLRSCAPFAGKPTAENPAWSEEVKQGLACEQKGDQDGARLHFEQAVQMDEAAADGWFYLARSEAHAGREDLAAGHFAEARDRDRLRFRVDGEINRIIREVCRKDGKRPVSLVDAETVISGMERTGSDVFWDHVHLTFAGNQAVGQAVVSVIRDLPKFRQEAGEQEIMNSREEVVDRLAYTRWDHLRIQYGMLRRRMRPPFTMQLDWHDPSDQCPVLENRMLDSEILSAAEHAYQSAIESRPDDPVLHKNAARATRAAGDMSLAAEHWREVFRLQPFSAEPCHNLGNLFLAAGRLSDAEHMFRTALEVDPDCAEAYSGLGGIALRNGRIDTAETLLKMALNRKSGLPEAHNNLGTVYLTGGAVEKAFAEWRTALIIRPDYTGARLNLARALWGQHRTSEAIAEVRNVLAYAPRCVEAENLLEQILTQQPTGTDAE